MKLTSSVFQHNGLIPSRYTCDANNISPPLRIENAPVLAKSMVLIMDDPDIPDFVKERMHIEVFDHWTSLNIDPKTTEIPEGREPGVKGRNGAGHNGYTGPCPPDREHRYFFKLYALDTTLKLHEGASKKEVETAMQGHVIAHAELIGRYERKKLMVA